MGDNIGLKSNVIPINFDETDYIDEGEFATIQAGIISNPHGGDSFILFLNVAKTSLGTFCF
jgi:hypothetical protein